ncbi:hypothetical protein [Bdellovibrio bacteriovorus]|uniref:Uncharacterized protein n=1 Tax=Bdellovibrio bacteriovorus TaxID=959 RepID=A0A1Z3NAL6_BDEBC|nr:hypothetical protein [Bdellovibrio bacteriovorus]ASD64471.1 hypothetical protein B9G79_13275 [Bdellovibrio bacteriovorus]
MSLAQANKNLKYDKRMTENKINAGEMTKEEWQKHLEQLPDLSHNVETFTMDGKNTKDDDNH